MKLEFTLKNLPKQISTKDKMREWLRKNPWPSYKFVGCNVIGKAKEFDQEELLKRNKAMADPRNDPRFKNIGTMHPSRSSKFTGKGIDKKKGKLK